MACVLLAGLQGSGRPVGLVGSVRIFLGLKADGAAEIVNHALLTGDGPVKEVARIDLDSRLIGVLFQGYAGLGAVKLGREDGVVSLGVEDPVVVISLSVVELVIIGIDVLANELCLAEIHRGPFDRSDLAGGHERVVHRGEIGGVDVKLIILDAVIGRISGKVEIGMVGHVDDRGLVGGGLVTDVDGVVLRKGEGHIGRDMAREVGFSVGRVKLQFQGVAGTGDNLGDLVLPTIGASMEAMAVVILRELILNTFHSDLALVDTVGVTANRGAKVRLIVLREIILDLVEAQDDILVLTLLVRNHHGDDAASEIGDADFHTGLVGQRVKVDPLTVPLNMEGLGIKAGLQTSDFDLLLSAATQDQESGRTNSENLFKHGFKILLINYFFSKGLAGDADPNSVGNQTVISPAPL